MLHPGHDAAPAAKEPAVGRIVDLVAQTRAAGQPVEFVEDPSAAALEGLTHLAVYRVVQEGLTNALKHAPGRRTVVRLEGTPGADIVVQVATDGDHAEPAPPRRTRPPRSGRGLDGLRRRVALAGGEVTAQRSPDGSFLLDARFPTRTDR